MSVERDVAAAEVMQPDYGPMTQFVDAVCYQAEAGKTQWYPPLMLSADSIAQHALRDETIRQALALLQKLEPDDYSNYLSAYYAEGLRRFSTGKRGLLSRLLEGAKPETGWRYADIVTVLLALSAKLKPQSYLEIGVRRGRSVCAVASQSPACDIYMLDMWVKNYAGMDNPGEVLVNSELSKVGHTGRRIFRNGNSHITLKELFREKPLLAFDLITVDGDHSRNGAIEDLCDVLPRLKIGGAVVFDDICHPKHRYLKEVWQDLVVDDDRFTSWSCADIGYGVGFALRKW